MFDENYATFEFVVLCTVILGGLGASTVIALLLFILSDRWRREKDNPE